jgi:hypothetical protein
VTILDQYGPIVRQEYDGAEEWAKPEILTWLTALPCLSSQEFRDECERWIYEAALVNRFRGNWDHVHVKATACYEDAERRNVLAGHAEDCRGPSIYTKAHAAVMRSHGYTPTPAGECVCGLASEVTA